MDYSPRGSSVPGISQARILTWVAISFSRGSSRSNAGTIQRSNARLLHCTWASQVALGVKNLPASEGYASDAGSIPRSWRSPREGNGNPLQYSCLKISMDRGTWWATVHRVARNWTWWKRFSTHSCPVGGFFTTEPPGNSHTELANHKIC